MNLLQHYKSDTSLVLQQEMTTTRKCSYHTTPQITSAVHSVALIVDPLSQKNPGMKSYTTSAQYEPRQFDAAWPEVSTRLVFWDTLIFGRAGTINLPKRIIKSKALDDSDDCYIFSKYYKSIRKESHEKQEDFIDDDDDDEDIYYACDGYVNDPNVINDVELKVKNTQYTK